MFRFIAILALIIAEAACLLCSSLTLADEPAAGQASTALKVEAICLSMRHPKRWQSTVIDADLNKPEADQITRVRFKVDEARTLVVIAVSKVALPEGTDSAAYAREQIEKVKVADDAKRSKVLDERDFKVCGQTGRLIEKQITARDLQLCSMTLAFVLNNHEYRVGFIGEKELYASSRADVLKLLESFEVLKGDVRR